MEKCFEGDMDLYIRKKLKILSFFRIRLPFSSKTESLWYVKHDQTLTIR